MPEMRTVYDPFEGRAVHISNKLIDRLRGKYASGPHLPNGKPEFGWKQFEAPPIQHEAADRIELLERALYAALHNVEVGFDPSADRGEIEFIARGDGGDPLSLLTPTNAKSAPRSGRGGRIAGLRCRVAGRLGRARPEPAPIRETAAAGQTL